MNKLELLPQIQAAQKAGDSKKLADLFVQWQGCDDSTAVVEEQEHEDDVAEAPQTNNEKEIVMTHVLTRGEGGMYCSKCQGTFTSVRVAKESVCGQRMTSVIPVKQDITPQVVGDDIINGIVNSVINLMIERKIVEPVPSIPVQQDMGLVVLAATKKVSTHKGVVKFHPATEDNKVVYDFVAVFDAKKAGSLSATEKGFMNSLQSYLRVRGGLSWRQVNRARGLMKVAVG